MALPVCDDDERIDKLVDGELDERERARLLESFDREPSGWRRCALAFLESQCLRQELHHVVEPRDVVSLQKQPAHQRGLAGGTFRFYLSLAATVLVSVGVTLLVRELVVGTPTKRQDHSQVASRDGRLTHESPRGFAGADTSPRKATETISVLVDDMTRAPGQILELPLYEPRHLEEAVGRHQLSTPLPPRVRGFFERAGHRIEGQRRFAQVDLNDGTTYLIPVDDVQIYPASNDFQ